MSEKLGRPHPVTSPTDILSPSRKSEIEPSAVPQDGDISTPGPPRRLEEVGDRADVVMVCDGEGEWGEEVIAMGGTEGPSVLERAEIVRPRRGGEEVVGRCKREEPKPKISNPYEEERRARHIRAKEESLKQTEKLLATRSAELSGAQTFLSTTDRLSEGEVLGIVRDLNENIYQVAVNLSDEWEKLGTSQTIKGTIVDSASRPRNPTPVRRVLSRDPAALTFLLQSCICSQVAKIAESWSHHQELDILKSVYQRLSASGERCSVDRRKYKLTHH